MYYAYVRTCTYVVVLFSVYRQVQSEIGLQCQGCQSVIREQSC